MSVEDSEIVNTFCPDCDSPAWVGLRAPHCVNPRCRYFDDDTSDKYITELEERYREELDKLGQLSIADLFEDEDTNPQWGPKTKHWP